MKSALLVNLPKYDLHATPAAIGILRSMCEAEHFDTNTLDFNVYLYNNLTADEWLKVDHWCKFLTDTIPRELEEKIIRLWDKAVQEHLPDSCEYMMISVFSYWTMYIARLLITHESNKLRPYKLVVGGNGCSSKFPDTDIYFEEWNKKGKFIEHLLIGEGENPLATLLSNGKIKYDESNLDSYPFPSYGGVKFDDYSEKKLYITGSRGCVRKCKFCDIGNIWPKFRFRTVQSLVDEIKKQVSEHGIKTFEFTDSLINGSVSQFYKFNEIMANEKQKNNDLKDVTYMGQFICRPKRQMPEHHYEAMYYAGCKQLTIGIESFSNSVRDHMGKKFGDADIQYHLEQCAYWNVPNIFLMISGYPTETDADHKKNLMDLEKYSMYAKLGIIELISWTPMHLIPDTPITSPKMMEHFKFYMEENKTLTNHNDHMPTASFLWSTPANKSNNPKTRLLRLIDVLKIGDELGYNQPKMEDDFKQLVRLSENYKNKKQNLLYN